MLPSVYGRRAEPMLPWRLRGMPVERGVRPALAVKRLRRHSAIRRHRGLE